MNLKKIIDNKKIKDSTGNSLTISILKKEPSMDSFTVADFTNIELMKKPAEVIKFLDAHLEYKLDWTLYKEEEDLIMLKANFIRKPSAYFIAKYYHPTKSRYGMTW